MAKVKLSPGTTTVNRTSPAGSPIIVSVGAGGNTAMIDGLAYAWNETEQRYQTRVPPPPANPPGEWHWWTFESDETCDKYETQPSGSVIWTQHGTYVQNG